MWWLFMFDLKKVPWSKAQSLLKKYNLLQTRILSLNKTEQKLR